MRIYEGSLSAGGTATATLSILTPETHKRIGRVVVVQTAGTAATYDVEVSTDSAVTSLTKRVFKATGGTAAIPIDLDNSGRGYLWYPSDDTHANALNRATCRLYVKVTPASATDNAYSIRVYFDG